MHARRNPEYDGDYQYRIPSMSADRKIIVIITIAVFLTFVGSAPGAKKSASAPTTEAGRALATLLSSSELSVRRSAIGKLRGANGKQVARVLLNYVDEPDDMIRYAIFKVLLSSKDPKCYEAFISGLQDEVARIRAMSAEGLGKLRDKRAAPFLTAVLSKRNSDYYGVSAASKALVAIGSPSVEHLTKLLHTTPHATVRAIQALARMSPEDGGQAALIKAVENKDPKLRLVVVKAMVDKTVGAPLPPIAPLVRVANDKSVLVRREVVTGLARNSRTKAARDALYRMIDDDDLKVKQTAVSAICRYITSNGESPELLVKLLGSADSGVRLAVLESMMKSMKHRLRGSALLEALVLAVDDESKAVRFNAVRVLGHIGDLEAIKPLLAIIAKTDDSALRKIAMCSLVMIDSRRVSDAFIGFLDSKDLAIRLDATSAMAHFKHRRMVDPLKKALIDPHSSIRLEAVKITARFSSSYRSGLLLDSLKDPDVYVRVAAARAMRRKPKNSDMIIIDIESLKNKNAPHRFDAMRRLIKMKIPPHAVKPVVDVLTRQLSMGQSNRSWLYYHEIEMLCDRAGDKQVIPVLLAALKGANSVELKVAATKALGRIEDKSLVWKHLVVLLKDQRLRIRRAAITAILPAGEKIPLRTFKVIIPMLKDENSGVTATIIRALGESRDKQALEPLQIVLAGGVSKMVGEARIAVAKVDSKFGLKHYIADMKDSRSGGHRQRLAGILEKTGKKDLVEALITAISCKSEVMGCTALYELRIYGDQRAIEPIKAFIKTSNTRRLLNAAKETLAVLIERRKKP